MLNFKYLRDPRSAIDQEGGQKRIQALFFQKFLSCCCFVGKSTFSLAWSVSDVMHLLPAKNTYSTFLKSEQGCWALQQSWSMSPIYSLVLQACPYLLYPSRSNVTDCTSAYLLACDVTWGRPNIVTWHKCRWLLPPCSACRLHTWAATSPHKLVSSLYSIPCVGGILFPKLSTKGLIFSGHWLKWKWT